jgi:EmrB/QacA subfamily drug resistance transporter
MSHTPVRPAPAEATGAGPSHRQILTVLTGLMMGMFLAALDQTIVASAVRMIADQLHGQASQAWVTTAYLIAATVSTPLYGKLSDIYGRKPLYLVAISLFLVGSVLCGTATSIHQLALFRGLQGLGGGGLMSLALTIIAGLVPARQRSRYQGYSMATFGVASVVGPVLGGLLAGRDSFLGVDGWRWVFLLNVPLALAALIVVVRVLNVRTERVRHRVDYWGSAALAVALVPLLMVAEQGRDWGWGSAAALATYGISALGFTVFVVVERTMGAEALLPLRMFRQPAFRLGNIIAFVVGIGLFGGLTSLPLYLQIVRGLSPTRSGLLMLPMMVGIIVAIGVVGRLIAKTGRVKAFPVIGSAAMAVGLFLFSLVTPDTSLVQVGLNALVLGGGLGLLIQTLTLVVQSDATRHDLGVATASVTLFRQTGGAVGAAVFLSILFSTVADRIAGAMRAAAGSPEFAAAMRDPAVLADPHNQAFLKSIQGSDGLDLNDTSFLDVIDPRLARPVLEGFSSSLDTVFFVGGCVAMVAFVLAWLLPDIRLD